MLNSLGRLSVALLTLVLFRAPAGSTNPAEVAFIEGFSGKFPHTAIQLYRGAELYFDLHKDASKRLRLVKIDSHGSITDAVRTAREARKRGVRFFAGASKSGEAIAIAKALTGEDALFITAFATNPAVSQGRPNVFQVCFDDNLQGSKFAEYAVKSLRPDFIVALTNIDELYSIDLAAEFVAKVKSFGFSPAKLLEITYSNSQSEVNPLIQSRLAGAPGKKLIYIPDYITRASLIAKQIHYAIPDSIISGGDGFGGLRVFKELMKGVTGIRVLYTTHWNEEIRTERNEQFLERYHARYNAPSTSAAAMAFDNMAILDEAVKRLGATASIEAYRNFLEATTFATTVGDVRFSKGSHSPAKPVGLIEATDSGERFVRAL